MKIESILPDDEVISFNELVREAAEKGAQAVRWHSPRRNVMVIGICDRGDLLTWFATPAGDAAQAKLIELIVVAGCAQITNSAKAIEADSAIYARAAIQRAKANH